MFSKEQMDEWQPEKKMAICLTQYVAVLGQILDCMEMPSKWNESCASRMIFGPGAAINLLTFADVS